MAANVKLIELGLLSLDKSPIDYYWRATISTLYAERYNATTRPLIKTWLDKSRVLFEMPLLNWRNTLERLNFQNVIISTENSPNPSLYSIDVAYRELLSILTTIEGQYAFANNQFVITYIHCLGCQEPIVDHPSNFIAAHGGVPFVIPVFIFHPITTSIIEISNFLGTQGYFQLNAHLLGYCRRKPNCLPNCNACGNTFDALLTMSALDVLLQERICASCFGTGLIYIQPPKPNLRDLKLYRNLFSSKKEPK